MHFDIRSNSIQDCFEEQLLNKAFALDLDHIGEQGQQEMPRASPAHQPGELCPPPPTPPACCFSQVWFTGSVVFVRTRRTCWSLCRVTLSEL